MHIGLIGGIGPVATDFYYRGLIAQAAARGRALDLPVVHADAPTLLHHLAANAQDAQVAIYLTLTKRLQAAGADCVVVTSIGGHFCVDAFAPVSPLPVIDLTEAVATHLHAQGLTRVGILGTHTVMASGMYGKLSPVEVLCPDGAALEDVHHAYVTLATSGQSTQALQDVFFTAGRAMMARGAEAILLGGTDINGAFDGPSNSADCGFPVVDCAGIHVDAIAERL
ncbi:MAG: aspartate/glutamate racemase family protein [Pseudomonadota bacterium]